jgi:MarR family transcriptional regulator, lower aerobic nicotinate degradation pathway regulator
MKGEKVIELVKLFEEFHQKTGKEDLQQFGAWLNKKEVHAGVKETGPLDDNRMLVWLTHRLSKMFRWYAKTTLGQHGLSSMDEYFFLVSINRLGTPSKTEVYADTITEMNTGTQMMKRMIEAGLVQEMPDSNDRRVKRVRLTAKGKKAKEGFFKDSQADLQLKAGNLTGSEKTELLRLLGDLEKFHSKIYFEGGASTTEELIAKYLFTP